MEIRIQALPDTKRAIMRWKDAKKRIHNNVFLALLAGVKRISLNSKIGYLSGPRPQKLAPVTGRLRRIQGYTVGPWQGNLLEGKVGYGVGISATEQVAYDWIHERGFHGIEYVKPYSRMQNHIFGVPVSPYPVNVPAHTRIMNMPPRPYLGPPTFKQYIPIGRDIAKRLGDAINE